MWPSEMVNTHAHTHALSLSLCFATVSHGIQSLATRSSFLAQVPEGELVFGVAHIYASFNDTFVHVTDISGKCVTQQLLKPSLNRPVALLAGLLRHSLLHC